LTEEKTTAPTNISIYKKNTWKNTKQQYMIDDEWVSLDELAARAHMSRSKAFYLLSKCDKTPKQVVEFGLNKS